MAVIVPDVWEQPPDVDAMRSASRATLAGYKVPTVWKFVTELPRNAAGKPLRCKSRTCRTDSFAAVIESSPDAFKSGAARVRVAVEERRTSEPFVDSIDLALDAAERVDDSMRPGTVAIGHDWVDPNVNHLTSGREVDPLWGMPVLPSIAVELAPPARGPRRN